MTAKYSYLLPRMNDCIDFLADAPIFLTSEASSGYWKIKIDEMAVKETAFTSHSSLDQIVSMRYVYSKPYLQHSYLTWT